MICAGHHSMMAEKRLPYDNELEWIDTNGAYITTNTGLINEDFVRILFTGTLVSWSTNSRTGDQVIGSFESRTAQDANYMHGMRLIANRYQPYYYLDNGFRRCQTSTARWSLNSRIELDFTASPSAACTINGVSQTLAGPEWWGGDIPSNQKIAICSCYNGTGQRARLKIESLSIVQSNGPILTLKPVIVGNVATLYDEVSDAFVEIKGGSFLPGPVKS